MSILNGSISFCKYKVTLPKNKTIPDLNEKISPYKSSKLNLENFNQEQNTSWSLHHDLRDELNHLYTNWDLNDCKVSGGLLLQIRNIEKKIPTELFQLLLANKISELKKEDAANLEKLNFKDIREELKEELLSRVLPSISYIDLFWRDDNIIFLFTLSRKKCDLFEELFRKTFITSMKGSLIQLGVPLTAVPPKNLDKKSEALKFIKSTENILPTSPFSNHAS